MSPRERKLVPSDNLAQKTVDRFRTTSTVLVAGSLFLSAIFAVLWHVRTSAEGAERTAAVLASFLLISAHWRKPFGFERYVSDVSGTLAVIILGGLSGAAMAMLGLRLQLPLFDSALRAADHVIGLDAVEIVSLMSSQQPWFFRLMSWGYHYTLPTIAGSVIILSIVNRVEAWRLALCFVGTLITICLIAMFIPAKGIGVWTPDELLTRLPGCSMVCFWPTFDRFYSSADPVLALKTIDGVISCPSFHAAMGCTVYAAWRINLVTFFLASVWFVFLMLGTLPYGGHYVVDLIAGCAVWLLWFMLTKWLEGGGGQGLARFPVHVPALARAAVRRGRSPRARSVEHLPRDCA